MVDAGDVGEQVGEVCAVKVEGVDGGVAVGIPLGDGVEGQALDPLHEPVDRGRLRAHGCDWADLGEEKLEARASGLGGMRNGPAARACKNGNGGVTVVEVGNRSRTTTSNPKQRREWPGGKERGSQWNKVRPGRRAKRHGEACLGKDPSFNGCKHSGTSTVHSRLQSRLSRRIC